MRQVCRLAVAACVVLGGLCAGCRHTSTYEYEPPDDPPPNTPPRVTDIEIPYWPPIGPEGHVVAHVADAEGLDSVIAHFVEEVSRDVSGRSDSAAFAGAELGEGLGELHVIVIDDAGAQTRRIAEDVLVDLTPPRVELPANVLAGDGDLEVWVGDAWVLGDVQIRFGGVTMEYAFPELWPGTLGREWDRSAVFFDAAELPAESGTLRVTVSDAAGNRTTEEFDVTIDGVAPEVAILSPGDAAVLSGEVTVAIEASDDLTGAPYLELCINGPPVATARGAYAEITFDTADFVTGPALLVAVAFDDVGNRGESAPVAVVLE